MIFKNLDQCDALRKCHTTGQLAVKELNSSSYVIQMRLILDLYNILSAFDLIYTPPPSKEEIVEEANEEENQCLLDNKPQ